MPASAISPDGHVELLLNLGHPVDLAGPAYKGRRPDRVIVGPLPHAVHLE